MKYVAVCVLSVATMLSASASPSATHRVVTPAAHSAQLFAPALLAPAALVADGIRSATGDVAPGTADSMLMLMLAGALITLQLRRRQKSLRSPRTLNLGT